jgi:TP901 family phage tail tape measure protein
VADYNLGTARGKIVFDVDRRGSKQASNEMDNLSAKAGRSSKVIGTIGKVAAGGTLAIAAGFVLAANSAANFEQRISAIAAVSGATGESLQQIRDKALQLGKDTKFSASEAASAMEELAKAGLSTRDILNGAADATVALAAAGEIELPQAATISANAMNAFNLAAKDLPRVADLIAGAANASAIDVGQFGQALQQSGAVAHLAGVSFADLSVAIAEMGNAGIKGSDAGTSLKTFLQNLIPTTKQQIELSKKLGLITKDGTNAFFDQHGKVKKLADVAQVLQNALQGMSKEQQLATLQTLFGSDAIRAAAILAENGASGFNKLSTSMGKVKAADVAKTRMDNLKGSIEQLKGSAETLAIIIGEQLQKGLKGVVDSSNAFLGQVIELAKHLPELIAATKQLIGEGLERLRAVWHSEDVQRFVQAIARLVVVLQGPVITLFKGLADTGKVLAAIVGVSLLVAFDLVSRAMAVAASTAEFVSRNWGLIAPIIVALSAVLLPMLIILMAQLVALGVIATVSAAKQVAAWVVTQVSALRSLGIMIITSAALIGQWIAMGAAALAGAARIALAWLIALGPIGLIVAAVIAVALLIFLNFNRIKGWIAAAWNFVKTITAAAWAAIKNAVVSTLATIVSFFAGLPGRILRAIGGLGTLLYSRGRETVSGLLNGARNFWGSVIAWFSSIPGLIGRAFSAAGTWLFGAGMALLRGFINGVKSMVGELVGSAVNAAQAAIAGVKHVLHIGSPSRVAAEIGRDVVRGMILGIDDLQANLVDRMSILGQIASNINVGTTLGTPTALGRSFVTGAMTQAGSRTWAPTVVVNNAPPTTTAGQMQEALRRVEALHSPVEVISG